MPTVDNPPISKKKLEWSKAHKPEYLRGTALVYNASIQDRYNKELVRLIKQMTDQCQREMTKLFKTDTAQEFYAEDASITAQAKILVNQLSKKFTNLFASNAQSIADRMISATEKYSSTSLHESLKALSGGLSLKTSIMGGDIAEIIKASVTENVGLIKSVSQDYLTQMQGAVMRSITTGNGLEDLTKFFRRYEGVTLRRARLIANDQTKKVYSNLNSARMQKMGIDKYEWLHSSGGQEPRRLHLHLNGTIYSLKNPPIIQEAKGTQPEIRGKPGDLINCKCKMLPVVDFDQWEEK